MIRNHDLNQSREFTWYIQNSSTYLVVIDGVEKYWILVRCVNLSRYEVELHLSNHFNWSSGGIARKTVASMREAQRFIAQFAAEHAMGIDTRFDD